MSDDTTEIAECIITLQLAGYTVLKTKSYKAAQERQRIADRRREWAEEYAKSNRSWAVNCLNEERRLRDRCTLLWGLAARHGATENDLIELNASVAVRDS